MDYEQRHPILQEIYEYLKNTPKEQIDKDWSYIFKETHPDSYYEQKYKDALKTAKVVYHDHRKDKYWQDWLTELFPELKESEDKDERIRKVIYGWIYTQPSQFFDNGFSKEEMLAWVEKQGKEESALKSFRDEDVHEFTQYIENQAKAYEFNLPNRGYDIYAFAKDILHWLEKQGEKKPNSQMEKCLKCQFNFTGYCDGTCILKNNEQKPVDKVEPKFKLRDWIVDNFGNYWRVVKVLPDYYELEGDDGVKSIQIRKYVDEKYHLWTIDDAKKGDILVVDGIWIVEFDKKMTGGYLWKDASILTSFEYDMDDDICTTGSHVFYKEIWPASKEDIDLFKKKRNEYLASNSHNESKFKVGDKV